MGFLDRSAEASYDARAFVQYSAFVVCMTALMFITKGFAACIIPVLAIAAITQKKPIQLMFWVLFMTLISVGNRQIFNGTVVTLLVVRVTLVLLTGLVALKAFDGRSSRANALFWGIMPYMVWEVFISLQGYEPIVSYLKMMLFFCIFLAMFGVANTVNASSRVNAKILRSMFLAVVSLIIIGSVLIIPFPTLSLMSDRASVEAMLSGEMVSLFCGMCAHSQAMGPCAAILGTFIYADLVFSVRKWDKLYLLILVCCAIIVYKTSSRTAMGTLLAGMMFVTWLVFRSKGMGRRWKMRVMTVMMVLVSVCSVVVISSPRTRESITKFALKWNTEDKKSSDVTVENMFSSRQALIDQALYNFRKKPILGNGFQVSEQMMYEHRSSLGEYIAAPIEKGVWFYAILEEGGIVGFILFAGWLVILFPMLIKRKAYVMAATFFAFMVANTGEFSIFSMSYIGGFFWTVVFAADCLDVQRMKSQNIQVFTVPIEVVMQEITAQEGLDAWTRRLG